MDDSLLDPVDADMYYSDTIAIVAQPWQYTFDGVPPDHVPDMSSPLFCLANDIQWADASII